MSREKPASNPLTIVVIVINLVLIVSLIKNASGLYQARYRLDSMKEEVANLEQQKRQMEWQAQAQTDPAALDQVIRNKLNLAKPGDTVVVIAGELSKESSNSAESSPQAKAPLIQWWEVINPEKI